MEKQKKAPQDGLYDFYLPVKDTRTKWQRFKDFIYDPKTRHIFGRPKKNWGISFLFYLVFYAVLALMCAVYMKIFLYTLDREKPRWILDSSIIGTSPGMGYRPMDENNQSVVIMYAAKVPEEVLTWKHRIDDFLAVYNNASLLPNEGRNQVVCNFDKPRIPGKTCMVDVSRGEFGDCAYSTSYGYDHSSPCVFIKLNKIYGWVPEFYDDMENLPQAMPSALVQHIRSQSKQQRQHVWVSCSAENPHDREAIGTIKYYPQRQGFPGFYFPYENVPGFLSPLVAVKFLNPRRGQLINVECRAWAKNIQYSVEKGNKKGSVHFELLVD